MCDCLVMRHDWLKESKYKGDFTEWGHDNYYHSTLTGQTRLTSRNQITETEFAWSDPKRKYKFIKFLNN